MVLTKAVTEYQATSLKTAEKKGEYWSQRELDVLFKDRNEGATFQEIAAKLERSYFAVEKMHSMGKLAASMFVEKARGLKQTRIAKYDVPQSSWSTDEW